MRADREVTPKEENMIDDIDRHVMLTAHVLADRRYRLEHPGACRANAWVYATRNWEKFVTAARDFIAFLARSRAGSK